jgi:Flp pilus assembly protein TadD
MWQADVQAAEAGPKAAVPIYRELFKRFATTPALVRLHGALMASGQAAEAKKLADTWQSSHPDDIELREYLGESGLRMRDYASAAEHFKWVVERRPGNVTALNNLSWVLVKLRQPGAVDYALRANAIRPDSAPMLDTLSTALAADKQFSKAIETQKRAVALAPNEPGLKLSLARIYEQAGQSQAARTELQALAALGDKFPGQAEVKAMLSRL